MSSYVQWRHMCLPTLATGMESGGVCIETSIWQDRVSRAELSCVSDRLFLWCTHTHTHTTIHVRTGSANTIDFVVISLVPRLSQHAHVLLRDL